MRTYHGRGGPFQERPHFSDLEIDQMCEEALQKCGLLPTTPAPIRIERFVEKHFGVTPIYEDLPTGVLGYTTFSANGVKSIHVGNHLVDERTKISERRLNSTLAHEAGHGLMHAYLFALQEAGLSLFGRDSDVSRTKVLCRDEEQQNRSSYDGRWWELQANKAIGSLLLPRAVFQVALSPFLTCRDDMGGLTISLGQREKVARTLADVFEVNPAVARLRLNSSYPQLN